MLQFSVASQQKVLWSQRPPKEYSTECAAFSPDGKRLYTGGAEGCLYEIDTKTGSVLRQFQATRTGKHVEGQGVTCVDVSPDGAWVGVGTGPYGEAYLFNVNGSAKPQFLPHVSRGMLSLMILSFSPESKYVATVGGGMIKIWGLDKQPVESSGEK